MDYFIVDVFTSKPFSGNPAAVVLGAKTCIDDKKMQDIAKEMNLSDTAFPWPLEDVDSPWKNCKHFKLRWFTPGREALMCGHATVATAHILFQEFGNKSSSITFETLTGRLTVDREQNSIRLTVPSYPGRPLSPEEANDFEPLMSAVAGDHEVIAAIYEPNTENLLVRINSSITRKEFDNIEPNYAALKRYAGSKLKGIILTVKGDFDDVTKRGFEGKHFASRYFAPWYGILEDPVTGSSHATLAPFWGKELSLTKLNSIQCSIRTGRMTVTLREDDRVEILGNAVIMCAGKIRI